MFFSITMDSDLVDINISFYENGATKVDVFDVDKFHEISVKPEVPYKTYDYSTFLTNKLLPSSNQLKFIEKFGEYFVYKILVYDIKVKSPAEYIEEVLNKNNVEKKSLVEVLGISYMSIFRLTKRNFHFTPEIILKISKYLKIDPQYLFQLVNNYNLIKTLQDEKFLESYQKVFINEKIQDYK